MYTSSDDALTDNHRIEWPVANKEIQRHSGESYQTAQMAQREQIAVRIDDTDEFEIIRCSPKSILEWLGY